jgi:DNA-binding beta-propeller fold protein YncE
LKKLFTLGIVIVIFICSACNKNDFTKIDENKDIIISVNKKVGSLSFLDQHDLHKITEWNLNRDISGASIVNNGKDLVVFHPSNQKIDFYNLSSGKNIDQWVLEKGTTNLVSLHFKEMIAVSNGSENTVTFYNKTGKMLKKLTVGKNPISMIEDHIHSLLYISLFNERKVIAINLKNFEVQKSIEVPLTSMGLQLNDDSTQLYVGGHGNGEEENEYVNIYSTSSGKLIKSLHAPLMPISFFQNEDGIFTIAHGTNQIYKLNPSNSNQKEFIEIGSNPYSAVGFSHTAYVASYDLNKLYQINTTTMTIEKEAKLGRGPFQLLLREGIRHE